MTAFEDLFPRLAFIACLIVVITLSILITQALVRDSAAYEACLEKHDAHYCYRSYECYSTEIKMENQ